MANPVQCQTYSRLINKGRKQCIICLYYFQNNINCYKADFIGNNICTSCTPNIFPFQTLTNVELRSLLSFCKIPIKLDYENLIYRPFDDDVGCYDLHKCCYYLSSEFKSNISKTSSRTDLFFFHINCRSLRKNGDSLYALLHYIEAYFDVFALPRHD